MKPLKKDIDSLNRMSETVRPLCDKIIIESQRAIAGLHAGKPMDLARMRADVKRLNASAKDPLVYVINRNLMFVAYQEYAEAEFVWAIVNEKELPDLPIPSPCYFTGLCDSIGEVRRQFMLALIEKDRKRAESLLKRVLKLGSVIAEIDASPAVINTLKVKKDLVQRCIESMLELSVRTA
jgi:translin